MAEKAENDADLEKNNGTIELHSTTSLLQWSQWQLLDSILPTGGFAHSFGLEAAVQSHLVSTPEDLQNYVTDLLENTGSLLLPFVYATSTCPNIQTWREFDRILNATLTNEISRKASILQGSSLMRTAAAVFVEIPCLKTMRIESLKNNTEYFHHATVFGLLCGLIGMDSETCQKGYMFITMRDVISAATRLNLVGPLGAAVLQHKIALNAEDLSRKWMNRCVDDACQTSPMIDTIQGCHSYLFTRLFCS